MCLEFPGQVVALDAAVATIDTQGRRRRASTLLMPGLAVGDWVYVAAGTVIERLEPIEARRIRETLLAAMELDAVDRAEDRAAAPDRHEGRTP
jgi:hydrogenase assembly chaperone HypC/HupF